MKKTTQKYLRWGYSTGACAAAVAVAAWERLRHGRALTSVMLRFLDGKERKMPLLPADAGRMAAIRKQAGDDPDCTDKAVIFARMRACAPEDARDEDYRLTIRNARVILRGVEGVGLCTRLGLDCEQGRWAINSGPRKMIADNLERAGLDSGCWLLEIGVENGESLAMRTLNPRLGVRDGISLLGTTGLVRPYSHAAYIATIRICVKSHALSGGTSMVFCTGGRTRSGAQARLRDLPETAFTCIGDFIAESLVAACRHRMREIIVACMPGKLCKYAAGFANTHAHKVDQDMDLLRDEVRRFLPSETALHVALQNSVSVREALVSIPENIRSGLLRRLARVALEQFARRCTGKPALRLLLFDFEGGFLFEETRPASETSRATQQRLGSVRDGQSDAPAEPDCPDCPEGEDDAVEILAEPRELVGEDYFMRQASGGRIDVLSCGVGFPADAESLALLEDADTVYGSRALLQACPTTLRDARSIGAQARGNAAEALELCRAGRRVVVLASGDALYHGFGGTLSGMAEDEDIVYHPGITAFQALFHRLGLPWHDARLFYAHSGDSLPARAIAEAPLSVTYAGSRHPADAIARAVLAVHPASGQRAAVIAECLGSEHERILSGPLESLAHAVCGPTSILALFPHERAGVFSGRTPPAEADGPATAPGGCPIPAPVLALGLPEDGYERENNLITASDVRAVILSRLRLPAWGTFWDIGAGSGSVGLEAAALRPGLHVCGVERKAGRGAMIERNRSRMGIDNYSLHLGEAPDVLASLPDPDRVFIGGGGKSLPALLTTCLRQLRAGGILAASAVTLESFAALLAWAPEHRMGLCRLDIADERPIAGTGHALKHQNTIHVFTYSKEARA